MHKLFVCQTCKRDEPLDPGALSRGARLADALGDALQDDFRGGRREGVSLVRVACLNGCPNPCNVALRAPRKYSLRLSRLSAADAPLVLGLLRAYMDHDTGDVSESAWPKGLSDRLSARVPPPHLLVGH